MILTIEQLMAVMPGCKQERAEGFLPALNDTLTKYAIDTPLRVSHFLAQLGHESASLCYTEELASGRNYEGRADLGNTQPGDGIRFKGRGLIQITGRINYAAYGKYGGVDLIKNPKLLAELPWSVDSAGWFWTTHKLNAVADDDDLVVITKRINGGTNGLEDRKARYSVAKKALGI